MTELTTLQLARKIADAVCANNLSEFDDLPDHEHPPTQAVLDTLRRTGSWFCRLTEDGDLKLTVSERYADVQQELFAPEAGS